ncbi:hypothetical protein [Citrobacter sp. NCU1]|nr:hypothetical protein [Citrobacter sp. NCU1]
MADPQQDEKRNGNSIDINGISDFVAPLPPFTAQNRLCYSKNTL